MAATSAAMGSGLLPFVGREVFAQSAPLLTGSGNHRYEWVRGWGKLADDKKYGSMHGDVVVDAEGLIYFSTDGEFPFIVYDSSGRMVRSFGADFRPDRDGNGSHGMQIFKDGGEEFIFMTSLFRAEAVKMTLKGEVVWIKPIPLASGLYKEKKEYRPTSCTLAPNGDVFVTDGYGANVVHHYDARGDYLGFFGGKGKEDGMFATPHKATIDARSGTPLLLVTDRANKRLQWFDMKQKHVKTLEGSDNELMRAPSGLFIKGDELLLTDLRGRLTVLDKDNKLITHLGDSGVTENQGSNRITSDKWQDGFFVAPHGAVWDKEGNIYVSEWSLEGRIDKLRRIKG
jgi:sugar lactone lactonase YvrE